MLEVLALLQQWVNQWCCAWGYMIVLAGAAQLSDKDHRLGSADLQLSLCQCHLGVMHLMLHLQQDWFGHQDITDNTHVQLIRHCAATARQ